MLGGAAWARYIEPEEDFDKEDFYEGGKLHKPALKYFPDLVQVIVEEEKDDPRGLLDQAAGGALASLGDAPALPAFNHNGRLPTGMNVAPERIV